MGVREGLLRSEFRDWYPRLVPGVWYKASWLAAEVLEQQRVWGPRWEMRERILSDGHFLFRGGRPNPAGRRARLSDTVGEPGRPSSGPQDTDDERDLRS